MNITDSTPQRRKIGIKLFCEDLDILSYNDVVFHIENHATRRILCLTTGSDRPPENTTRIMAIKKILQAKNILHVLKEESKEFSEYVEDMDVVTRFVYSRGSWCTLLAQEENGSMDWVSLSDR